MTAGEVRAARRVPTGELTPAAVAQLTAAAVGPCISVVMSTFPAPRMTRTDRSRLDRMVRDVERRVRTDAVEGGERLVRELRRQVGVAVGCRTEHALGIFVSRQVSRMWALPVTVHDKAVVEPTFATRDLFRAMHRTPPHVVVRVDDFGARVFRVSGRVTLLESVEWAPVGSTRAVVPASSEPEARLEDRGELLERIEAAVRRTCEEHPAPLVLAGDDGDLLAGLEVATRGWHRFAGVVRGADTGTPEGLFTVSALCVQDYLHRRGTRTLDALLAAAELEPARVVAGLDACRAAVADRVPGTLLVEQGYVHPGSRGDAGEACHDLVDDLIEDAVAAGELVAFVEDAELHEFGGVALLREPAHPR